MAGVEHEHDVEIIEPPTKKQKATDVSAGDIEKMLKNGSVEAVDKTGKVSSEVWKRFRLIRETQSGKFLKFAMCNDCRKVHAYDGGTTSNLSRHSCGSSGGNNVLMDRFIKPFVIPPDSADEMKNAAVKYVVTDMRPFEALANPGLQNLVATAMKIALRYGS